VRLASPPSPAIRPYRRASTLRPAWTRSPSTGWSSWCRCAQISPPSLRISSARQLAPLTSQYPHSSSWGSIWIRLEVAEHTRYNVSWRDSFKSRAGIQKRTPTVSRGVTWHFCDQDPQRVLRSLWAHPAESVRTKPPLGDARRTTGHPWASLWRTSSWPGTGLVVGIARGHRQHAFRDLLTRSFQALKKVLFRRLVTKLEEDTLHTLLTSTQHHALRRSPWGPRSPSTPHTRAMPSLSTQRPQQRKQRSIRERRTWAWRRGCPRWPHRRWGPT